MLVRQINIKDVPSLIRLGHFFWKESVMSVFSEFPEQNVYRFLFNGFSSQSMVGWCIESECIRQGIIFVKSANIWSNEKQLNEIAWFSEKDSRFGLSSVKLIKEAEKWAKNNGFIYMSMGRIKGCQSYNKLPKFYERIGFQTAEEIFIKKL